MPIPDDWADPNAAPRIYPRGKAWDDLRARFAMLGDIEPLKRVFEVVEDNGATHTLHEPEYIDADYRDEFANFYASTFPPFPDRCERLHFFGKEGRYLGYCVLRPIPGRPICRTMIRPPDEMADAISCVATSVAQPYGHRWRAAGFPFMGQDYQYGVCAHASIWMCAYYHHLANARRRAFLSDMVRAAGAHQEPDRLTPSRGLSSRQIQAAFSALGMPAQFYSATQLGSADDKNRLVCRYLNSRLPVVLATGSAGSVGHATVLIGYRRNADGLLRMIRNDDARGPYREFDPGNDPLGSWRAALIPMPGRIYLSGEVAEKEGHAIIEAELGAQPELAEIAAMHASEETRVRSYVTTSGSYKQQLSSRGMPAAAVNRLVTISASHWIWVVELQERALGPTGRAVIGEVAIDATSDDTGPRPLFAFLPGAWYRWPATGGEQLRQPIDSNPRHRYTTGCALLD